MMSPDSQVEAQVRELTPRRRRTWLLPLAIGLTIGALLGFAARSWIAPTQPKSQSPSLQTFAQAVAQVRDNYVEPRSEAQLLDDGLRGVMGNLDEHSVYLDER